MEEVPPGVRNEGVTRTEHPGGKKIEEEKKVMFERKNSRGLILVWIALVATMAAVFLRVPAKAWDLLPGEAPPTGPKLVQDLHCHDCHLLPEAEKHTHILPSGLRSLPSLDFEGNRTRPEWILDFLRKPFHLRPELHAQMPNFALTDEEAMSLIAFLMTLKLKKEVYVPKGLPSVLGPHDAETMKKAKDVFYLYKCYQCHLLEGKVIDPQKGQSGPDFIYTYNRLQVDWNYQWLVDPQAFIPGTTMPNFFYSDGESLIDEPEKDMYAILVYMYSLGEHKDGQEYRELQAKYSAATPERGKKLAEELSCTACHEFEGWPKLELAALAAKDPRLDLMHVGTRRDKAWLTKHLGAQPTNPRDLSPGHWPGYILNPSELKTLVDYLLTIK